MKLGRVRRNQSHLFHTTVERILCVKSIVCTSQTTQLRNGSVPWARENQSRDSHQETLDKQPPGLLRRLGLLRWIADGSDSRSVRRLAPQSLATDVRTSIPARS